MSLLSIAILSSERRDLLEATIHSLLSTVTYKHWELVVYNHDGSIGNGWNHLIKSVRGEHVLMCQDDWYFIERWDWAEIAMKLSDQSGHGIVRLRKNGDGQVEEKVISELENGKVVECAGGGFSMNPFICRRDLLEKLGEVKDKRKEKGVAELELRDRYKNMNLKTLKLSNPACGVCVHIGRGRRVLGKET